MKTETYDNPAEFLAALHGKPRAKRGKATRPDLPSAPPSERTGLSTTLAAGWNFAWDAQMRCRLYRGDVDTGYCEDEAECVKKARQR